MSQPAVTFDDALEARARLLPVIRRTPLLDDPRLDEVAGRRVVVKAEHLQRSASFKFRGLFHKIASLGTEAKAGIVVVSSGNAAHAAALAACLLDVPCTVVMPERAVETKVRAVADLGATIVRHGATSDQMFAEGARLVAETGAHVVHPFDQPQVVAGHASLALEVLEDAADVRAVYVPASGGGLLAATALAVKHERPDVRVIGVQPRQSDSIAQSLVSGSPVTVPGPIRTVADALIAQRCGELTLGLIRRYVDDVVLVDDEEMCVATRLAWTTLRQVVEPSAAASLAALLRSEDTRPGVDVAVLTGGNVDPALFAHVTGGGTAADWLARP